MPPLVEPWGEQKQSLRAARLAVVFAGLVFVAGGLYGIRGPFVGGHYAYHAGQFSASARNLLRGGFDAGVLLPNLSPSWTPPMPGSYRYIHHPPFADYLTALSFALFGDGEATIRATALFGTTAALIFLAVILWRHFGPWAAALGAFVYAVLPYNARYAIHLDQAPFAVTFLLLFFVGYLQWLRDGRWRNAALACASAALAGACDWVPLIAAVPIGLHVLYIASRRGGRFLAFVPLYTISVVLLIGVFLFFVWQQGLVGDLTASYGVRIGQATTVTTLAQRMLVYWKVLYGQRLLEAMGLWTLIQLVRLSSGRGRARDLVGITFLFSSIVYSIKFKDTVMTHAYRPPYLTVAAAIACVDLALWARALLWRLRPRRVLATAAGALVACALLVETIPLAWSGLLGSRQFGGVGLLPTEPYDPQFPLHQFGRRVRDEIQPGDFLHIHQSFQFRRDMWFYFRGDERLGLTMNDLGKMPPADRKHAVAVLLPQSLVPADRRILAQIARVHPITEVCGYMLIDFRSSRPRVHAECVDGRGAARRGWLAKYLDGPYGWPAVDHAEDRELALILQLGVPQPPDHRPPLAAPAPSDLEGLVRDHNYQRLIGDGARAAEARTRLSHLLGMTGKGMSEVSKGVRFETLGARLTGATLQTLYRVELDAGAALPEFVSILVEIRGEATRGRHDHRISPAARDWQDGFIFVDNHPVKVTPGRNLVSLAVTTTETPSAPMPKAALTGQLTVARP